MKRILLEFIEDAMPLILAVSVMLSIPLMMAVSSAYEKHQDLEARKYIKCVQFHPPEECE